MRIFGPVVKLAQMPPPSQKRLRLPAFVMSVVMGMAVAAPHMGYAQNLGQVISPILIVDRERLFTDSSFGQSILATLNQAGAQLEAETRVIVTDLEAEELNLSALRSTLPADEFRALAEAFDIKVQQLRLERSAAEEQHLLEIETARVTFLEKINPILASLMQEAGAFVLMERRSVVLSANSIEVTARAIARIDVVFAAGTLLETTPEIPVDEDAPAEGGE